MELSGAGSIGSIVGSSPNLGVAGAYFTVVQVMQYAANVASGPAGKSLYVSAVARDSTKLPVPTLAQAIAATALASCNQVMPSAGPDRLTSVYDAAEFPTNHNNMFSDEPAAGTDGYGNTWALGDVLAFDYIVYGLDTTAAWTGTLTFQTGASLTIVPYS